MDILLLVGGLLLILIGANGLTDGAASVAKRFRIPSIVIGLTIVAFGTSAPELAVSVSSALKGSADIAIGNVVGSNIFNTLMIVGCTALFAPIVITRNTLRKEIPLCILSSIALLICANDILLNHATENVISITDGLLLLCFFAIFMGYTFAIASGSNGEGQDEEIRQLPMCRSILYIIGGLARLIRRAMVCGRGQQYCPQPGCKRIDYRTYFSGRGNFSARTGHFDRSRIEEEPGNSDWKRDRQ